MSMITSGKICLYSYTRMMWNLEAPRAHTLRRDFLVELETLSVS